MKKEYLERIYAGWLAKIIGIRYGAPVEGWTYLWRADRLSGGLSGVCSG